MTRGVAQSLICPRCGQSHPPTGDRALVTCSKCTLVFTVDAGSRDQTELRARFERRAEQRRKHTLETADEHVHELVELAIEMPRVDRQQMRHSIDTGLPGPHPLLALVGAICERAQLRGAVATRFYLTSIQDRVADLVDGAWIGEDLDATIGPWLAETLFTMCGYPERLLEATNELVLHPSQRDKQTWHAGFADIPGGIAVLVEPQPSSLVELRGLVDTALRNLDADDPAAALAGFRAALARSELLIGEPNFLTAGARCGIARVARTTGRLAEALDLFTEAATELGSFSAPIDLRIRCAYECGRVAVDLGDFARAAGELDRAVALQNQDSDVLPALKKLLRLWRLLAHALSGADAGVMFDRINAGVMFDRIANEPAASSEEERAVALVGARMAIHRNDLAAAASAYAKVFAIPGIEPVIELERYASALERLDRPSHAIRLRAAQRRAFLARVPWDKPRSPP